MNIARVGSLEAIHTKAFLFRSSAYHLKNVKVFPFHFDIDNRGNGTKGGNGIFDVVHLWSITKRMRRFPFLLLFFNCILFMPFSFLSFPFRIVNCFHKYLRILRQFSFTFVYIFTVLLLLLFFC